MRKGGVNTIKVDRTARSGRGSVPLLILPHYPQLQLTIRNFFPSPRETTPLTINPSFDTPSKYYASNPRLLPSTAGSLFSLFKPLFFSTPFPPRFLFRSLDRWQTCYIRFWWKLFSRNRHGVDVCVYWIALRIFFYGA